MNTTTRTLSALTLATAALLATTACSAGEHTEQASFGFHATSLEVTNPNPAMPVTVHTGPAGTVSVSVSTTAVGKRASTPAWSLSGTALDLGSPCTKGYVGLCEGSYTVTVPRGTRVSVNGTQTPAG